MNGLVIVGDGGGEFGGQCSEDTQQRVRKQLTKNLAGLKRLIRLAPYAAGEQYFPDEMAPVRFYQPTPRGLEGKIGDKLAHLRELDRKARNKP